MTAVPPASDQTDLAKAYDEWHGRLDVDQEADSPWHQLVKRHLSGAAGSSILEVGCGRGGFARWLHDQGPSPLVAADLSPTAVAKASGFSAGTRARFEVADIQRLPHPDASFDVVISCETIEHVPRPKSAVDELARVLRPGGRLFLTTPNYLNLMGLYRAYRRVVGRPFTEEGQPINNLTFLPRTMSWLRSAGLIPSLVDARGHYVPFPGQPRPLVVERLDGPRPLVKWLAQHPLVIAVKPPQT